MTEFIYKICPSAVWKQAEDAGVFSGSGIDLADGFIHFSNAGQTAQTAHLHFKGQDDLVLVKTATKDLELRWEASRGGELFPHLYGNLPMSAVVDVFPMPIDEDGHHIFPDEITPLNT